MRKQKEEHLLKFDAIRPFGPTIVRGRLPNHLIELMDNKSSEMMNDKKYSKKFDHAPHLAGNVKQETRFDPEWLGSEEAQPMIHLIGEMVKSYLSIPPEFIGQMVI